jgi:multidrug efflux pump subunit AcrA (membrane-fusion protein)
MNAALAASDGAVTDLHPHASYRQLLIALVVLVIAVVVAAITVSKVTGTPSSYSGSIESVGSVNLDFANFGHVAEIDVHPGDTVSAGQVLAKQDSAVAVATLEGAKAIAAADQAKLDALQHPALGAAKQQEFQLQIQQVEAQLANARQATQDAQTVAGADMAAAQSAVATSQTALAHDQARFAATCPMGTSLPGDLEPGSSPTSTSNVPIAVEFAQTVECLNLQNQIDSDSRTLIAAQQDVGHTQAMNQQMINAAQGVAAVTNVALQLSQLQPAIAGAPSPVDVASAEVDLAQAQAQVSSAQAQLQELTITAPTAGVIAQVGGSVGDLAGPSGVHSFSGPAAPSSGAKATFSLFPPPASSSSDNGSQTNFQPLVSIQGGGMEAVAQVSESKIGKVVPGQHVRITVNALDTTVDGRVLSIVPVPIKTSSSVEYAVRLTTSTWPRRVIPGMSISVSFP